LHAPAARRYRHCDDFNVAWRGIRSTGCRLVSSFWTVRPILSDRCLSVCLSAYNVGVLWPNGSMDQDATWYGGRPRPKRHGVGWGPTSPKTGHSTNSSPPLFGPCLLWPNGWMDQDTTWYGGRPRARRHCVMGTQLQPTERGTAASTFQPILLWHGRPSQQLLSSCFSLPSISDSCSVRRTTVVITFAIYGGSCMVVINPIIEVRTSERLASSSSTALDEMKSNKIETNLFANKSSAINLICCIIIVFYR